MLQTCIQLLNSRVQLLAAQTNLNLKIFLVKMEKSSVRDFESAETRAKHHNHSVVYRFLKTDKENDFYLYIFRNVTMEKFRPRMDVTKALQILNFSSSTKLSDISSDSLHQKFTAKLDQVRDHKKQLTIPIS